MYGLITKFKAEPGKRDELISILIRGSTDLPGCRSYVIAQDASEEDAIWISEIWDSKEYHQASLKIPKVQEAMQKGKPLIAELCERVETIPVSGHGVT